MSSSEKIPGPAYRIETARLVLRCWQPEDAPLLKASIDESLDHLRPWMPWAYNEPETIQEKIQRLRRFRSLFDKDEDFIYGVFNAEESKVVGGTGLHTRRGSQAREIGYWINVNCIKQGFATELAAALTKVAFEVEDVDRVEIHCDPTNIGSAAVPRKLGFVHEATLKRRIPVERGDELGDSMIWSLFATDYQASPSAQAELRAFDALGRQIL